jgi:rhodanese-related sulfurtransferase
MSGARPSRRKALAGAILVAAGAALALGFYRAPEPADGASISAPEALAAVAAGDLILIDIRRPEEWAATGVAPGAVAIDMRDRDFTARVMTLARASPGTPVAFICARGVRSARVRAALAEAGLSGARDVSEGMMGSRAGPGWLARGLPVVPVSEAPRG